MTEFAVVVTHPMTMAPTTLCVEKPAAESLESCKRACVDTPGCRGIEFRPGRCEVWVRAGGIQATAVTLGVLCLRYVPFVLAAGLEDRACRGERRI